MNKTQYSAALFFTMGINVASAWLPGISNPTAAAGFSVDTSNRRDVLAFYQTVYNASESYAVDMQWNGNVASGQAGTTSAIYKEHVRRRINFYRALCGLPGDIVFDSAKNAKNQQAALMFSRNAALSHEPPDTWLSYSQDGYDAAYNSNIASGICGPPVVDAYFRDDGDGNQPVGHRRWLLFIPAKEMGTGDIPTNGTYAAANSIWINGNFKTGTTPTFVKWPNAGYCPANLAPQRWSLSYPGASFSTATVTMSLNGVNVPTTIVASKTTDVGDNTVVWSPVAPISFSGSDVTYQVTVSNIANAPVSSHTYSVTLFDPNNLGESVSISGSATPSTFSSIHTFNPIDQADSYQLTVAKTATPVLEGAEDATSPFVTSSISAGYTLRQTTVKRVGGAKGFQLSIPVVTAPDQSFTINRNFLATATSSLQFYQLCQYATPTTTLAAQVSTDDGVNWKTFWSRTGVAAIEPTFTLTNPSLSAYAGKIIKIRFSMSSNQNSSYSTPYGFFIDDITVLNATELSNPTLTNLSASATSYKLNSTTAGAAITAGTNYIMAIRPSVGLKLFPYGPVKTVTPQTPVGYDAWVANSYPAATDGQTADQDSDGLSNAIEYAFGLSPLLPNANSSIPQPSIIGDNFRVSFTASVSGVTYAAQWSPDLIQWNNISDSGSGNNHVFSVPTAGKPVMFIRHAPVVTP